MSLRSRDLRLTSSFDASLLIRAKLLSTATRKLDDLTVRLGSVKI